MSSDPPRFSLRRWSQRKLEAARKGDGEPVSQPMPQTTAATNPRDDAGAVRGTPAPPADGAGRASGPPLRPATTAQHTAAEAALPALPPVESLTIDSDYAPYLQPGVDADVKRSALRKLFRNPRFNVMDGLDVYIDDYSKPDPIDPAIVRTLVQARYIFDPPKTRVNVDGHVEDVPEEPAKGETQDATLAEADPAPATPPAGAALPSADATAVPAPAAVEHESVAGASGDEPRKS